MLRVYSEDWDGGDALPELDRSEWHHLVRVRRAREGEAVELLNGRGHLATCRLVGVRRPDPRLDLQRVTFHPPPVLAIRLCLAIPKAKALAAILHKAVELGIAEIQPLLTRHTEGDAAEGPSRMERWQAILVEALKQSGNPWLTAIREPLALEAFLQEGGQQPRLCAALQPEARPLASLAREVLQPSDPLDLFIGPEGDFSDEEYAALRTAGCHFASLGPRVLKVETAAVLAAGCLGLWAEAREVPET